MADNSGHGVEFTPGDDNCTKTVYPFSETKTTPGFITLYDESGRGYYFRYREVDLNWLGHALLVIWTQGLFPGPGITRSEDCLQVTELR